MTNTRILLLEKIHSSAARALRSQNWKVTTVPGALNEADLGKAIRKVTALGIRSKTRLTVEALREAENLQYVGCFCIGSDQVDIEDCTNRGVAVFNAPYSNTRSVSELVIGQVINLLRSIVSSSSEMHQGHWNKATARSVEVRGKTLGIIGYGHVGAQVSILAEALGMDVVYHDIRDVLAIGNVRKAKSLKDLLSQSDIATLHVPDTSATRKMIGPAELQAMKKHASLINTSRGNVVDIEALAEALKSGHLQGAAVDVFPVEPSSNGPGWESPLRGLSNAILTPHIAGSTREAQREIGLGASEKMIKFLSRGTTTGSLNFPQVELPALEGRHRVIHVHRNVPGMISKIGATLSRHKINIEGQRLETNDQLGYLVTDIDHAIKSALVKDLSAIPNTIRVRALY